MLDSRRRQNTLHLIKLVRLNLPLTMVLIPLLFVLPAEAARMNRDIPYATKPTGSGEIELTLDLYQPEKKFEGTRPLLLYIHGGGFTGGAKDHPPQLLPYLRDFTDKGYVVASIDYRLHGDDPVVSDRFRPLHDAMPETQPRRAAITAAVEDATAALEWLIENAERWSIDPGRIAIGGGSAGAGASLILGYAADDMVDPEPPRPDVVLAFWGNLNGWIVLMDADDPPLMLIHGDADTVVPVEASHTAYKRAQEIGLPSELVIVPGGGHSFAAIDMMTTKTDGHLIRHRIYEFLEQWLPPAATEPGTAEAHAR